MAHETRKSWVGFLERGWFAPALLSIQPILHLFSINDTEVYFSEVIRSLFVSLFWGAAVLGLAYLLLRDGRKASPVAALFLFLFFLFGDLSDWLMNRFELGSVRADLLVLGFVSASMLLWIWLVQKWIRNTASLNLYFNLLGIFLLLKSGVPVGSDLLKNGFSWRQVSPPQVAAVDTTTPRPDIYYIILDGYGRQDILQEFYDFDNSEFLAALQARGFYIAEASSSNYVQTMLSLSSSLNMQYIQDLDSGIAQNKSRAGLIEAVENSRVREVLAQNGYQLVSFRNSYTATVTSAELYYDDTGLSYPVTAFESLVIDRSLARVLLHVPFFRNLLIEMPYETHRSQILSTFTRLQELPRLEGDYFVYAHIIAPHPPFVFDEEGTAIPHREPFRLADGNNYIKNHSREEYVTGYRQQIQYINTLVLKTVDAILRQSETPPIILLQGDHGPGSRLHQGNLAKTLPAERFGILNAYYFPDQEYTRLYDSISPVNSFRILLDQFFGTEYGRIPDQHYYSTWGYPFDFTEIKDLSLP